MILFCYYHFVIIIILGSSVGGDAAGRHSSVGKAMTSDQKVAGSTLKLGISSLCPWKGTVITAFCWSYAIYSSWWPSPAKDLQTELQLREHPVLAWLSYTGCLVHANEKMIIVALRAANVSFVLWKKIDIH